MAKVDTTDIQSLQEKLNQAKNDKTAAADLLKSYSSTLYREACLYLDDETKAKEVALRTIKKAYKNINKAEAETFMQWLNTYVQDECINEILPLQKAKAASYTSNDEVPDRSVVLSSEPEKIKNQLRSVLKRLTPSQRLVCILKYRDQCSFEGISDLCDVTEADVKNILTQVKSKLKSSNINLGILFAMINQIYPYYKEPEKKPISPEIQINKEITTEDQFIIDVQELKDFFNTKAIPVSHISDRYIDDLEESNSEEVDKTFEMKAIRDMAAGVDDTASSAKMIMAAAMSADADDRVSEKEYNPKMYWIKRILMILAIVLLGVLIGFVFTMIRANIKPKPVLPEAYDSAEIQELNSEETELIETINPIEADTESAD